uniref:Uncharacterized protein n=1 Tax=Leersia perrieri TaxID=77586 RepID=A0A0D9XTK3_9ORYZ
MGAPSASSPLGLGTRRVVRRTASSYPTRPEWQAERSCRLSGGRRMVAARRDGDGEPRGEKENCSVSILPKEKGLNDFDRELVGDADFRKPRTSNNSDEEMQFDDLSDADATT